MVSFIIFSFVCLCVSLCVGCLHENTGAHRVQKGALKLPGARMRGNCEPPDMAGTQLNPLQEQNNLITAEPSLQPL